MRKSRRYVKADAWGWCDIRRDFGLAFPEVMLLRVLVEQADYRSQKWSGTIVELHEMTGLGRKTIRRYIDKLVGCGLCVEEQTAHGERPAAIDVSACFPSLIVPNRARGSASADSSELAAVTRPWDDVDGSPARHMAHASWDNASIGGSEAVEEKRGSTRPYAPNPVLLAKTFRDLFARSSKERAEVVRAVERCGVTPSVDAVRSLRDSDVRWAVHYALFDVEDGLRR